MRGVTPRRRGVTALPTHPGIRARRLYEDQARSLWVVSGDCLSMLVLWACARGRGMRTPKRNQSDVEVVGPGAIEGGGLQCQCTLESDRCGRVHERGRVAATKQVVRLFSASCLQASVVPYRRHRCAAQSPGLRDFRVSCEATRLGGEGFPIYQHTHGI